MDIDVTHRPAERKFLAVVEGRENSLSYRQVDGDTLDLQHTWVDPKLRGRGIGERLVRAALDHARDEGLWVIPSCWYVGAIIRRRKEYAPLVR